MTALERLGAAAAHHVEAVRRYRYARRVFLVPPWKALFAARRRASARLRRGRRRVRGADASFAAKGYDAVIMPRISVAERADFLEAELGAVIPVRGYAGHRVAVLGLGAVRAAGGRGAARRRRGGGRLGRRRRRARARPRPRGSRCADLTRAAGLGRGRGADRHRPASRISIPTPHPAVAAAWEAGVAVDNDVGLFFRSFATPGWDAFERTPQVVAVTGSNGKSTTTALIAHVLAAAGRPVQIGGNIGRGVLDLDPAVGRHGRRARAVVLPDRARPGGAAGRRGVPQPLATIISTGTAGGAGTSRRSGGCSRKAGRRGR